MREELQRVRDWANDRITAGDEPPWAWFQYMKLRETADAILQGMAATTTESSPQLAARAERHLRLVGAKCSPDSAQPHQLDQQAPLPM